MKREAAISLPLVVDLSVRPPVATDLGIALEGAAMPHPDPKDPLTTIAGVVKRFAIRPPAPDVQLLDELGAFVDKWLVDNLTPLEPHADTSFEAWIEKTNYPLWRKGELRAKWEVMDHTWENYNGVVLRDWTTVKSFMKDETYDTWKYARAINSRTDEFKSLVGPIFRLIEEKLYEHPSFVKHIPVAERPQYIYDLLYREAGTYYVSDYTAFESLFVRPLMEKVEFRLYEYMTKALPCGRAFMDVVVRVLGGLNWCEYRDFFVSLVGSRMSGEMNTSLGNGFSNLMFMLFVLEKSACRDVRGVVEGDDGLFTCSGTPDESLFDKLGLRIKLEKTDSLAEASFCGMIFDTDDRLTVTNPLEVLASVGWASARYSRSGTKILRPLLRCKALSLAHQYPGCPIISALAHYVLRETRDVRRIRMVKVLNSRKGMSMWERDQLLDALADESRITRLEPPINTRFLVEKKYGITVEEQRAVERYFDKCTELRPLKLDYMVDKCPQSWRDYWTTYVLSPVDLDRPIVSAPHHVVQLPCRLDGQWLVPLDAPKRRRPRMRCRQDDLRGRAIYA